MKLRKKNADRGPRPNGFTILEMMIVMLVVAVLLMITLPNVQSNNTLIRKTGCQAMLDVIDSQILLFEIEHDRKPVDLHELLHEGYLKEAQMVCPDGTTPVIENGQAVSR